jgi:hypothetical protein
MPDFIMIDGDGNLEELFNAAEILAGRPRIDLFSLTSCRNQSGAL